MTQLQWDNQKRNTTQLQRDEGVVANMVKHLNLKYLKPIAKLYTKILEDGRFRDSGCAQILVCFLDLEVRVVHIFLCLLSRFVVLPFFY